MQDYSRLKSGMLFIPTQNPLPVGTELTLKFRVPEIDQIFQLEFRVSRLTGTLPDYSSKKIPGMQLSVTGDPETFTTKLDPAISRFRKNQKALPTSCNFKKSKSHEAPQRQGKPNNISQESTSRKTAAPQLPMDWIKNALERNKEEMPDESIQEEIPISPPDEKKDLSPEERKRVKPVGEFIMDLTRAMLRSGYYSPDHPGSRQAKQGLYNRFQNILEASNEILIAKRETREKRDFCIMNILDEPIGIKLLVGAGRAELFEPKLRDYFSRKGLISFAIKRKITPDHFNRFIDIMCDPRTDDLEKHQIGDLLTRQLVENGITEISTTFIEDKLFFKEKLPWRVEMAMHRLAKDLKVLPQFIGASDETLKSMKVEIIKDILRPLKHPDLLKELIIHCYVIIENVKHLDLEEIEQTLVDAFPLPFLHATSLSLFKDIEKYKDEVNKYLNDPDIAKRYNSMKRILKLIAGRMIHENTPRVQNFLEQLYFSKLLTYEELPSSVKYQIDTTLMVEDLKANTAYYEQSITRASSAELGEVLVKWFHRVVPKLVANKDWPLLLNLLSAAGIADAKTSIFPRTNSSFNPFITVFSELTDELAAAYNSRDNTRRQVVEEILLKLDTIGIDIFGKVLSQSETQIVRKSAIAALGKKGGMALKWARQILDDPEIAWHLHRNALLIINKARSTEEKDIGRILKFVKHSNPRVREEALRSLTELAPVRSEQFIVDAVEDENERVRLRALYALSNLSSISEKSLSKLLDIISADLPDDKALAIAHTQKVTHLIRIMTINALSNYKELIQNKLIDIITKIPKEQKWFTKFVKPSVNEHHAMILTSAIKTLKNIGTDKSIIFIEALIRGKNPYAKFIKEAFES